MKRLHHLYVYALIVLLPILLLLYLSSVEADVYAAGPRQQQASLTVHTVGSGTVAKDPDQPSYQYGDVVTLTVTADPGWMFSDWSGDLAGSDNPETVATDGDKTVTPSLTQDEYTLTVTKVGSGTVDVDPVGPYTYGQVVTLTATADLGWTFFGWSGDLAGSDNPENLTIDGNKTVTATFQTLPVIDVWYGSHQVFGHIGNPQQWVNILGNVSDPDGMDSLTYSLNGGPELPLSIGPDTRRLASEGDFNVEIDYEDLSSGLNQVVITATDTFNIQTVETVTVEYVSDNVWPLPYTIDWNSVTAITDAVQIVDGLWTLEADSIRPLILGYDRLVAIGDMTWDDYEVMVPITIHGIDPAYEFQHGDASVGIIMRWNGHVDWDGSQPRYGWYPLGAIGTYNWRPNGSNRLKLSGNRNELIADTSRTLDLEVPYNFKMHVETIPGQGGLYGFKVWEASQSEPLEWDFIGQEGLEDPQNGSLLLMAHFVDASFGDVTITPGPFDDTIPPIISNIQVMRRETSATITWSTNEPATSIVDYGTSPAYENGRVEDSALVAEHTITLTGLISETLYHYQVTSVDESSNAASSVDLTFRTTSSLSNIVSDDFNTCELNTGLWTWTDPRDDATYAMTGTFTQDAWLSISIPAGTSHEIWEDGNFAPRIMQPISDTDFEIEIKFESGLSERYQLQGVLVEQDGDNLLRFNFQSDGSNTRIFAASFTDGEAAPIINSDIADTNVAPLYMCVKREGDLWTLSYSFDGLGWTTSVSFTHALSVTSVGAFVGNSDDNGNPAHTGLIDYFFNTASPVVPEDEDRNTLTVNVVGSGTVAKDPDQATYICGQVVTLTATAAPGWTFSGWSGDLVGSANPETLTMTGSQVVTATFNTHQIFLPFVIRNQ